MFENQHPVCVKTILQNSPYFFYETGSRFFGGCLPDSDYDYFVQHDTGINRFLVENGFKLITDPRYSDSEICDIYEYNNIDTTRIHIQVVKNAPKRKIARDLLEANVDMASIPKGIRQILWNVVLKALQY